jgi:hypothetical protein
MLSILSSEHQVCSPEGAFAQRFDDLVVLKEAIHAQCCVYSTLTKWFMKQRIVPSSDHDIGYLILMWCNSTFSSAEIYF